MTYIYNPQQLEPAENTFITALAFASSTGILTATRNDGVQINTTSLDDRYVQENTRTTSATFNTSDGVLTLNQTDPTGTVTVDLDGRFPTENTHLNSATLGGDNVLSLGMINPTSTITVDLSSLSDLNTHLDSASFNPTTKVLSLIMVNPSSTITVDLSGIEDSNTFVTSADFVDGTLNLNRNDGVTVSVDLDGRYSRINTHLNAASFDTGTRNLTLTTTDPEVDYVVNIPISPDENTFLTSLAFNTNSGELIATLNNDETVTVDLDGRFNLISNNTHVSSGSFDPNTGNITLTLVNPSSTITIPISDVAGQNTHLDSASLDDQTLNLNMINPESTIDVDLGELVDGKYLPINFDDEQANFNTLLEPGVYAASATGVGRPDGLIGAQNYISVYSQKDGDDVISATQIWTTGTNTTNRNIDPPRLWMRTYDASGEFPFMSPWKEITTGGINGYLDSDFGIGYRDFNDSRYRQSGYYRVNNIQDWDNGPTNIPLASSSNILNTVMNPTSTLYPDRGYGYQELHSVDADADTFHLRKWRRTFQSTDPDNIIYTDWFEYNIQGQRVNIETLDIFKVVDESSTVNVAGKRVIDVGINKSFTIRTFTGGVQGQRIDVIKTSNTAMVQIGTVHPTLGGNIYSPSGESNVVLRYFRGASFIYQNGFWFPLFSNSTS